MSRGPLVPAVPSCILQPLREEFLALLPPLIDRHPLGCHRRRIDDRLVFDKLAEALVFGWIRFAHSHLAGMFPHLPGQSASASGCAPPAR